MGQLSDLRFHPMCKGERLTHLAFADDIMILYKGNTTSVKIVMEALQIFYATAGLEANSDESSIFLGEVDSRTRVAIFECARFTGGEYPIR